jgi:mannose-6-phosphate isomerase-like protein (cupin superfamily)
VKLSPDNTPYDGFTSGVQVLPPGRYVREHGHERNHELIFIHRGTGEVEIEGETFPVEPGSTVLFGRFARHVITNTGDEDLHMFWVFMPPGLEDWFRAIGKARQLGDAMPEPFDRPDTVADAMERQRFVPPAQKD